jgi:tripartite-type tricarboxylate transporter receptor subunit TctC
MCSIVAAIGLVHAEDYPVRPITLVVSTAAGGGNDIMARVIGEAMSRTLGQQIVVENRPGAGGTTATRQIAKAAPSAVASVEPSSTTTTCTGWPSTSVGTRRTTAETVVSSSNAGKNMRIGAGAEVAVMAS